MIAFLLIMFSARGKYAVRVIVTEGLYVMYACWNEEDLSINNITDLYHLWGKNP